MVFLMTCSYFSFLSFLIGLQFTELHKLVHKTAKAKKAPKSAVATGPTMSASQAAFIVNLRNKVDAQLDTLGHTCLDGECGGN
mmetsp:Transcript_6505/g.23119  ORF Transcript_6505/g.23119 Transcript_6505/m.23119 type:complete len:83 (+) Transcript_6505:341-589(+)